MICSGCLEDTDYIKATMNIQQQNISHPFIVVDKVITVLAVIILITGVANLIISFFLIR